MELRAANISSFLRSANIDRIFGSNHKPIPRSRALWKIARDINNMEDIQLVNICKNSFTFRLPEMSFYYPPTRMRHIVYSVLVHIKNDLPIEFSDPRRPFISAPGGAHPHMLCLENNGTRHACFGNAYIPLYTMIFSGEIYGALRYLLVFLSMVNTYDIGEEGYTWPVKDETERMYLRRRRAWRKYGVQRFKYKGKLLIYGKHKLPLCR